MAERGNPMLRMVDSVAGPVLLRLASIIARRKTQPVAPKRIGLMCFGALGDLLLFSAIIGDVQSAYPEAEIVVLGSGTNKAIAAMLPLGNFTELPVKRPDKALKIIREFDFDLIVDSTQWAKLPALLCAQSGAYTIGFRTEGQRRHFAYDHVVDHRNDVHEIANFRALIASIAPVKDARPKMIVADAARAKVADLGLPRFAVLHGWPSGVRASLKEWPLAHWATLARHLHTAHGLHVVLTGAPVDAENSAKLAQAIGAEPWVHDMAGQLKLTETIALLEKAAITVSVNTGIMHMAATFDVPLVGLSGPTNPMRWGALSDLARNPRPACDGCWYLNLGFEYPDNAPDCMGSITPEAVIAAVEELLP